MEKYNYLVKPRIPIRNVIPGENILREKVLSLDLDQVKACLRHGPVYRKFSTNQTIQVTLDNCERLHNREYVSKIDANSTFIPKKEEIKVLEEPVVEEASTEEKSDENGGGSVEEVVEETAEDVTEEVTESPEESVEETEEVVERQKNNNNYNGKNKKKKYSK